MLHCEASQRHALRELYKSLSWKEGINSSARYCQETHKYPEVMLFYLYIIYIYACLTCAVTLKTDKLAHIKLHIIKYPKSS